MTIRTDISIGEFLDKISILEIKSQRMQGAQKLANVRNELAILQRLWRESPYADADISDAYQRLKAANEALWKIEDDIRDLEAARCFDAKFIELARAVYVTNDQRAAIKKEINVALKSGLVEEKSYKEYR
ncbi:MAG: DUF6165 family protein [Pseudomonadota bacterium]